MRQLSVKSHKGSYDVFIESGILKKLKLYINPDLFYVIIADDMIPIDYINDVKNACPDHLLIHFPAGELSKSMTEFSRIIDILVSHNIRKDAVVVSVGGGVTGDLSGFVASTYSRGLDFIQIPTTLLSQIDSSVGGKVAINTTGAKNIIGSIYPPKKVLIDPLTLNTLDKRQINAGMAEMIKYGMIADKAFFEKVKNEDPSKDWDYYIYKSLEIKKRYVEADEFDNSLRQSLNFGHTIGHALETYYEYKKYLHGEAVSIGMVQILSNPQIKRELIDCLKKYNLPTSDPVSFDELKVYINRDKKGRKDLLKIVDVTEIGNSVIVKSQFKL